MIARMQALERLWGSPAIRWPAAVVAAIVLFAGIRAYYVSTREASPAGPVVAGQPSGFAVYGHPIKLPHAAVAAARTFIHTAVERRDLGQGWLVSTAKVHAGLTRTQWMTGNIPVEPFPASYYGGTSFKVEYARSRNVMLEIQIVPSRPGYKTGIFFVQLVPRAGHWLVDYFGPRGTNPPIPASEVH
jgi:hypothetical protein